MCRESVDVVEDSVMAWFLSKDAALSRNGIETLNNHVAKCLMIHVDHTENHSLQSIVCDFMNEFQKLSDQPSYAVSRQMTLSIDQLPEELVFSICQLLPAKDIVSLIVCCRKLKTINNSEQLWKYLCKRVLHRLRHFLGFWWRKQMPYGGLLKIEVNRYGVSAYDCLTPIDESFKSVTSIQDKITVVDCPQTNERFHNLRYRLIFSFKPVGKDVHCFCYQSKLGHLDRIGHSPVQGSSDVNTIIAPERKVPAVDKDAKSSLFDDFDYGDSSDEDRKKGSLDKNRCIVFTDASLGGTTTASTKGRKPFKFLCHSRAQHQMGFEYWFEIEHGFKPISNEDTSEILNEFYQEIMYHDKIRKFETLTSLSTTYELYPLDLQRETDVKKILLIKPGLYFGTYNSHGWEIIDVRYDDEKQSLEGVKITGDANVFATKVTFRIFCDKPLLFSKSDQLNFESITAALARNQSSDYKEADALRSDDKPQDFAIPADASDTTEGCAFEYCYHRRLGEGQIAFDNFENATFTAIIFAAFTEDCFGLLWTELNAFSMFYRVKNLCESAKNL